MSCDKNILKMAMMCDPMVSAPADADALIEDLLKVEKDALQE